MVDISTILNLPDMTRKDLGKRMFIIYSEQKIFHIKFTFLYSCDKVIYIPQIIYGDYVY
jgi:hypothetical protein